MGYTTDFAGKVTISPALNPVEAAYLGDLAATRRMHRASGPFYVRGGGFAGQDHESDILNYNSPDPSQPGLWLQWVPTDNGAAFEWDGNEKFYNADEWMRYLVNLIGTKPDAETYAQMLAADQRFAEFTFDHVVNGTISAQGEDPDDCWLLVVQDNVVTKEVLSSRSFG